MKHPLLVSALALDVTPFSPHRPCGGADPVPGGKDPVNAG